jgi:hypothetical protein
LTIIDQWGVLLVVAVSILIGAPIRAVQVHCSCQFVLKTSLKWPASRHFRLVFKTNLASYTSTTLSAAPRPPYRHGAQSFGKLNRDILEYNPTNAPFVFLMRRSAKNNLPELAVLFSLIKANFLRNSLLFKGNLTQSKGNRIVK